MPAQPARKLRNEDFESPSIDDIQKDVEASAAGAQTSTPAGDPEDPRLKERAPLAFEFKDSVGRTYRGTLHNRVLESRKQNRDKEQIEARLTGGLARATLPQRALDMNAIQAHLRVSLEEPFPGFLTPPKSLDDLDDSVLVAMYECVQEHERIYFRLPSAEG